MEQYNSDKPQDYELRNTRSLQSRMSIISAAVKKMNGCVRQIENMHPSGASEQDILNRAKQLYTQGDGKKKGFKFDHVWSIVKDFEKFKDHNPIRRATQPQSFDHASSQSENPTPDSPTQASPGLSSFSLNLDDSDEVGGTSSQRPIGVKKAKLKRNITEETSTRINDLREDNRQLLDFLKKSQDKRQQREENKILYMDLNSIADPSIREYTRNEQSRILNKRLQQQQQQEQQDDMHRSNNAFNQYFNDIGGSGTGIPDY